MDLRPRRNKIIVAVLVILAFYGIVYAIQSNRMCIIDFNCPKGFCCDHCDVDLTLIPQCACDCASLSGLFYQIIFLILPGILTYLLWSLTEKPLRNS